MQILHKDMFMEKLLTKKTVMLKQTYATAFEKKILAVVETQP